MKINLPKEYRPEGYYRKLDIGLDVPSFFWYDLKAIDPDFYLVFHPYKVLYDSIINNYRGELEDPRYTINNDYGQLNFGFVLTDGQGNPLEDGKWHIWRLCKGAGGWSHVLPLESTEGEYLKLVINRLHLQASWYNRYGFISYNRLMERLDDEKREKALKDREELFNATQEENKWLVRKAMENLDRGITKPTNPIKETISSYKDQGNRSRIVRPLEDEDRESGLIVPESY